MDGAWRQRYRRTLPALALAGALCTGGHGIARAGDGNSVAPPDDWSRVTVLEENDSLFFNSDKHYTQGLRLSVLGLTQAPGGLWDDGFRLLGDITPFFAPGATGTTQRQESVFIGQSLFTPKDLTARPPDPHDRPYGGWLYAGTSLMQETNHHMLENAEIDLGVIGPGALGKQVQNDFHQFIGIAQAKGWSSQLQNEPGIVVSYERLWRERLIGSNGFGVDIVPQVGASGGNVFTYAEAGGLLRIGSGLDADYGPARVRPALSGTDYFDAGGLDDGQAFYFFVGTQGRAVARNIFLDGNTFRQSSSIPKKSFVGDVEAGFSLLWSPHMRFDTTVVLRSEEYRGQRSPDDICTAALTFTW